MLGAVTLLLSCQLAGEILTRLIDLPVPGPVLDMVFLFIILCLRGHVPRGLERVTDGLLDHLSLLFVPAGVGVIRYAHRIQAEWLAITVSLIGGTVIAIATTVWIAQRLMPPAPDKGRADE